MYIDYNTTNSWDCHNSIYSYPPAGRVITNNITSNGPKYRFPSNIDFTKCRREISSSLMTSVSISVDEKLLNLMTWRNGRLIFYSRNTKCYHQSKWGCKDQKSIQSSTTPDREYQWESYKLTVRHHKREPRGQPFPSRWPQSTNKQTRTKT